MFRDENFSFLVNVTREAYETKKDAVACLSAPGSKAIERAKMAFHECQVNVGEFLGLATSGYAFCNLFDFDPEKMYWFENKDGKKSKMYPTYKRGPNAGMMKMQMKSDRFFKGAQTVFVDVDFTRFNDVWDYLATLTIPPTCVYMSFSDKKEKGKEKIASRRFRMVYVFDEILGKEAFIYISKNITNHIIHDTGEPMEDDCGTRMSQYMNGVFGNNETYRSDIIYSIADFWVGGAFYYMPETPEDDVSEEVVDEKKIEFDKRMINDMERLEYDEFMHYYSHQYPYVYRVERDNWIGNLYQFTDDNYLQLYYYKERVHDGNHRRRKLFWAACLRRLMYPGIDPSTLLFNLYIDRERFYDNSDGLISITCLKKKVQNAFKLTIEDLAIYCGKTIAYWQKNRPKIIFKRGIGFQPGMIKKIYKQVRYAEIDKVYNPALSVRENIENGLDVPRSTLYEYCKERGYQTNPVAHKPNTARQQREDKKIEKQRKIELFQRLYDDTLTVEENKNLMERNGLHLSISTIFRWRNLYEPTKSAEDTYVMIPNFRNSVDLSGFGLPEQSHDTLENEEIHFNEYNWQPFFNRSWQQFSFS